MNTKMLFAFLGLTVGGFTISGLPVNAAEESQDEERVRKLEIEAAKASEAVRENEITIKKCRELLESLNEVSRAEETTSSAVLEATIARSYVLFRLVQSLTGVEEPRTANINGVLLDLEAKSLEIRSKAVRAATLVAAAKLNRIDSKDRNY